MSLHGALATRLSGQVSSVSGRAYRQKLPQNPTYPALTFRVIGDNPTHTMSHVATVSDALVEVIAWAATHSQAKATAEEVRTALDGWDGTEDGTTVQHAILNDGDDLYDDDLGVHGVAQDFFVMFNL